MWVKGVLFLRPASIEKVAPSDIPVIRIFSEFIELISDKLLIASKIFKRSSRTFSSDHVCSVDVGQSNRKLRDLASFNQFHKKSAPWPELP